MKFRIDIPLCETALFCGGGRATWWNLSMQRNLTRSLGSAVCQPLASRISVFCPSRPLGPDYSIRSDATQVDGLCRRAQRGQCYRPKNPGISDSRFTKFPNDFNAPRLPAACRRDRRTFASICVHPNDLLPQGGRGQHCGRRSAIEAADLKRAPGIHNMTSLVEISRRLRCQSCGSKAVKAFRPESRQVARDFLNAGRRRCVARSEPARLSEATAARAAISENARLLIFLLGVRMSVDRQRIDRSLPADGRVLS